MPDETPATPNAHTPSPIVLPGVSRRVLVATKEYPRFSEGDVVTLADGRLLLAVGRKEGAGDFAAGTIIGLFSSDDGLTWNDVPHVIRAPWDDVVDVMSVSFARTRRGLHLFFLGRGRKATSDTRVYQMISSDEGKTWGEPVRISAREGYHVVNNARVLRTAKGRLIVSAAWVPEDIGKMYQQQRIFCYLSDDDGVTWRESGEVVLEGKALMEPGVAECADGSIYMTIRTGLGHLYEARSRDGGETWGDFRATVLAAPAAPSTVVREPGGDGLWMFWCDNAKGGWKGRNRIMFAASGDHGRTWGASRFVEEDPRGSFGYTSVTFVKGHALLTYYDWRDHGQPGFAETSLRERLIPLAWFKGEATPPVFRTAPEPVLRADRAGEGKIVSMNSGLLAQEKRWRLWYTNGALGPAGERLRVCYAESKDAGRTWEKAEENVVLPAKGEAVDFYHASVHRESDKRIVMFVWRNGGGGDSGMWRYVSNDDGHTFAASPERAVMAAWFAKDAVKAAAGAGRESNDAFDVVRNEDGTYAYFAACVVKAADPRQVIKHDNAAGWVRVIGHASSADGVTWTPTEIVIEPDHQRGDPWDEQFYGMQVFHYRGFWLGLLFTFRAQSQVIQPEWAWSHNGVNWTRTRTPCAPLGDEGRFDSRMMLFGSVVVMDDEVVWLYSGYDWRHNAFKKGEVGSAIGRAVLPRGELDEWLASLPTP
jgi:sucrose-6-phosphate hydrolase SacC (GH32 family)